MYLKSCKYIVADQPEAKTRSLLHPERYKIFDPTGS